MGLRAFSSFAVPLVAAGVLSAAGSERVYLDELDLSSAVSGDQMDWNRARRKGVAFGAADVAAKRNLNCFGGPLTIGTNRFARGVGALGNSLMVVETGGKAISFDAVAGADAITRETWRWGGDALFQVWADDRLVFESYDFLPPDRMERIHADVRGARRVYLQAFYSETHEFTPVNWCDAFFTVSPGAKIRMVPPPAAPQWGVLTPPERPEPRINGPALFGVRPGSPILYTLPVTGERPMAMSVDGLPEGAAFDATNGFLRGRVTRPGTYPLRFRAVNAHGRAERTVRLVVGDKIALTPPMCWNSWNCYGRTIDEAKIRKTIDAFVEKGLVRHGWSYVNLDDFWMNSARGGWGVSDIMGPGRDSAGRILPNSRFPDMKALADYAHGKGLKLGLYSSPGPLTCGGCYGSWQHEAQDAATYAEWGIDFLKYDWCSLDSVLDKTRRKPFRAQHPYRLMGDALRAQNRDIIFDVCQYGGYSVPAWGRDVGGHMWRTTGDIMDIWGSCQNILARQRAVSRFAQPGGWNDPDMLVVGSLGWGRGLRPSRLTHNEQYTHVGLWAMLAAPMQIGCDVAGMDDFTRSLLTNDEMLEINQDELGRSADCVTRTDAAETWVKPMHDGSLAVAFFNRFYEPRDFAFPLEPNGIAEDWRVRDVWAQKDLGFTKRTWKGAWKVEAVPPHATAILRFYPPKYWQGHWQELWK